MCVDNYEVTRAILSAPDVTPKLFERVLVQLSTGTPQEARDGASWAQERGAAYLDGAILAYPDQMGTPDATILVAGAETAFHRCEPLLRPLGGGLTYVGGQVGAASALDCAILSFVFGALLGALHGARICEVESLPVNEFGAMLSGLVPVVGGEVVQVSERIRAGRYGDSHATLGIYASAAQRIVQQARDSRINPEFPLFASGILAKGVQAGFGGEDLAAVIKILRAGSAA